MGKGLTSFAMADDTEEVPLQYFSSSSSYNSNINCTPREGWVDSLHPEFKGIPYDKRGLWVDTGTLYAELS
jgi:hypothetical protein